MGSAGAFISDGCRLECLMVVSQDMVVYPWVQAF